MASVVCPYCHGCFKGSHGLSVHLTKSSTCADESRRPRSEPEDLQGSRSFVPIPVPQRENVNYDSEDNEQDKHRQDSLDTEPQAEDYVIADNSVRSHSDFLSQPFNVTDSDAQVRSVSLYDDTYDSTLEPAFALLSCNDGQGLSKKDLDRVIAAFTDPRFSPTNCKFHNGDSFHKYINDLQEKVFGKDVCYFS